MPKVSIIIPTCDRPQFLRRALESVRAQTFTEWEAIIVDDGSLNAKEVVDAFHEPRFRYVREAPPRRGGAAARNTGIRSARAPYIAFLDDDDIWLPQKLAIQYRALSETTDDVGFSVTAASVVGEAETHLNTVPAEGISDFSDLVLTLFKGFLTSTLMVRRAVFDEIGMFDEALPSHQETDLVIRMTRRYRGVGIAEALSTTDMTAHEHIGGDITRRIRGREMLLTKHAALFAAHPRALAKNYFWLGLWYRDAGRGREARRCFSKAFFLSGNPRYALHSLANFGKAKANTS